ncbi:MULTISPECIES: PilZ domain-containing protein [Rheinheimera]|uniref:PilZ domain-containing protein n=1 Tax=Rheinheimera marina TaxID=1774958 RepID=A0ABV9JQT2_9GAMM
MLQPSSTQRLEEFNDYFQVEQSVSVNLVPFDAPLPDDDGFYQLLPDAFKMTSELSALNSSSSRALTGIKDLQPELISYLQLQTRKIDALMHYVLRNQDDSSQRFQAFSFGGSGVRVQLNDAAEPGQLYELKLFLDHNEGAVFALAELIDCEPSGQGFLARLLFRRIREDDRDLVVRASLHEQSRQLKRKAEARQAQQTAT